MIKNEQNKLSLLFYFLSVVIQAGLNCLFYIYKDKLNNWGLSYVTHKVLSTSFIWLSLLTKPGVKNA